MGFLKRHFITILTTAIGLIASWWFYTGTIDPVYITKPIETIATKASPRLAMTWDGLPVENLCLQRLALWNDGQVPITQSDLPSSDPLRAISTGKVHILAVEKANASRPTLHISTKVVAEEIRLAIEGGDALENRDGVGLRILFAGDCKTGFRVAGRVIGSKGFRLREQADYSTAWMGGVGLFAVLLVGLSICRAKGWITWIEGHHISRLAGIGQYLVMLGPLVVIGVSYWGNRTPGWLP